MTPHTIRRYLFGAMDLLEKGVLIWPSVSDLFQLDSEMSLRATLVKVYQKLQLAMPSFTPVESEEEGVKALEHGRIIRKEYLDEQDPDEILIGPGDPGASDRFKQIWQTALWSYRFLLNELQPRFYAMHCYPDVIHKEEVFCFFHDLRFQYAVYNEPGNKESWVVVSGCIPLKDLQ